jgi:dTDP-4-amino-4,6-dideoxygalactose transaminase
MSTEYAASGRGIGGDFSLSLAKFYEPDRQDFRTFFDIEERACLLFDSGRSALKWCLQHLAFNRNEIFLLPSYLCPAVLQPFNELYVHYEFYEVNDQLRINVESIKRKMGPNVRGLLIIHYFGFPVATEFWDYWSKLQNRPVLVEDCSQALLTKQDGSWLGHRGEYSFTSLRKWLPVPDGSWLFSKRRLPDTDFSIKNTEFLTKRMLGVILKDSYLKQDYTNEEEYQSYLRLLHEAKASLDAQSDIIGISKWTVKLLNRFDWQAIIRSRQRNYRYLASCLEDTKVIRALLPELPPGVCPLGSPIVANSPEVRDTLKESLVQHGIYPPIHWQLPMEVNETEFPASRGLSRRILTIPIDQRYGDTEMEYISGVLRSFDRGS